uniref:TF-B3 domain-containing protein n=2 Tax=Triticum urartu TaxID=4572 RepID=A0A8R7UMY3_TRIUA
MGTSFESCKLRDEQHYKNLDDEKQYFLVLILGDFQDAMIIPKDVVPYFKGEIPGEIKLETRNGYCHTIVVAKNQEKHVLTVGWRQFVESYDLQEDDSLIFRYKGNSQFSVMIFDKLGPEKALSVVLDPFWPQVQDRCNEAHENGYSQKMEVPRKRRKSRIEYHYANLDDEKKYFLVLMMDNFQHEMIIPKEFVQCFKGEFPGEMILETQNRCSYEIGVAKNNENLVLIVGWDNFVETFGLEMGDAMLFRYNGNSQFNVIIFDESGCEKASSPPPVQERRTSATDTVKISDFYPQPIQMVLPESPPTKRDAIQTQPFSTVKGMPMESPRLQMERDKSCQDNSTVIKDDVSSEEVREVTGSECIVWKKVRSSFQKEQLKDRYITAHKSRLTSAQKEVVKQKVQSIQPEIPFFVAVMRKCNVVLEFFLVFPKRYAKAYLKEKRHLSLQVMGKEWPVWFRENSCDKRLGNGWKRFVEDNKLKMGDMCLFELLRDERTMEVHIIP